jgi:tetratricopeptide (TPR) repeat protein
MRPSHGSAVSPQELKAAPFCSPRNQCFVISLPRPQPLPRRRVSPRLSFKARELFIVINLVRADLNVSLVPRTAQKMRVTGVCFYPVKSVSASGRSFNLFPFGYAEASYRLGMALLQEGKVREARTNVVRPDHLQPEMPETLYSLGKAASLDGDDAAAHKAWTALLGLEKDSRLAGQAHFALANLYRKQGKTAEAEHEIQEFSRLQTVVSK